METFDQAIRRMANGGKTTEKFKESDYVQFCGLVDRFDEEGRHLAKFLLKSPFGSTRPMQILDEGGNLVDRFIIHADKLAERAESIRSQGGIPDQTEFAIEEFELWQEVAAVKAQEDQEPAHAPLL